MMTRKNKMGMRFRHTGHKKKLQQKIISNGKGIQCDKKYDTIFHVRFIGHKIQKNEDIYSKGITMCCRI